MSQNTKEVTERHLENGGSPNASQVDHEERVRNALTNTMTLSPEVFERIYLSPKMGRTNSLSKQLGNPTPIALLGFAVGLMPLSAAFSTSASCLSSLSHTDRAMNPPLTRIPIQWDGADRVGMLSPVRPAVSGSAAYFCSWRASVNSCSATRSP